MSVSIALLPAGPETTASSRLRVYTFARELHRRGVLHSIGETDDASIVVVQKKLTDQIVAEVLRAKQRGAKVVYDVDDLGGALWWWAPRELFLQMTRMCDAVITATSEQASILASEFSIQHVHVVSNCIDYFPTQCEAHAEGGSDPLRVLWFGDTSNVGLLRRYLPALLELPDSEIVVCSHEAVEGDIKQHWPTVRFAPWRLESFVKTLTASHVTCLMHDGDRDDRAKGNNRMVTSIAWGVPACVSRTPAYVATAREGGVDDFVFETEDQLIAIVSRLRSRANRVDYLRKSQQRIWSSYAPSVIADRYLDTLEAVLGSRIPRRCGSHTPRAR